MHFTPKSNLLGVPVVRRQQAPVFGSLLRSSTSQSLRVIAITLRQALCIASLVRTPDRTGGRRSPQSADSRLPDPCRMVVRLAVSSGRQTEARQNVDCRVRAPDTLVSLTGKQQSVQGGLEAIFNFL